MTIFQKSILLFSFLLLAAPVFSQSLFSDTLPLGGNGYTSEPAQITDDGVTSWTSSATTTKVYIRIGVPQTMRLFLRLQVPAGTSEIQVSSGSSVLKKALSNKDFLVVPFGDIKVSDTGYLSFEIKGLKKSGAVFANVSDLILQHAKQDTGLVYVKKGSSYHFGRRGPSVHLNFLVPDEIQKDVHWFYNELEIPAGQDKLGSYFMADGFGEGYFGMQVNSDTERRVLFSVWSPFETENPKDIPDSLRIKLLAKGPGVHAQDFGNEGSGGQSYLVYPWKAGSRYIFLLGAAPDSVHHITTYTAYFKDEEKNQWHLIARFSRPQTLTYLTHLYSFLENFIPETGDQSRSGWYKNQWVRDGKNQWHELLKAKFTVDATAKGGYRKDYAGGADKDHFFLRNDGFFNDYVKPYGIFTRQSSGKQPAIDFATLPGQ